MILACTAALSGRSTLFQPSVTLHWNFACRCQKTGRIHRIDQHLPHFLLSMPILFTLNKVKSWAHRPSPNFNIQLSLTSPTKATVFSKSRLPSSCLRQATVRLHLLLTRLGAAGVYSTSCLGDRAHWVDLLREVFRRAWKGWEPHCDSVFKNLPWNAGCLCSGATTPACFEDPVPQLEVPVPQGKTPHDATEILHVATKTWCRK